MSQATESVSSIIVHIPIHSEQSTTQEYQWYFQKIGTSVLDIETHLYDYINEHKLLLTLSYILLFLCSVLRIVIYLWLLIRSFSLLELKDQVIVIAECVLSGINLCHYIVRYISRLRQCASEDSDFNSLMYILFCTKYFSLSYWTIALFIEFIEAEYAILIVVLFIAYAFLTEKSPGLLIIIIYTILMCFLLECLFRALTCKYKNPWKSCGSQRYKEVVIPITCYSKTKSKQRLCGICLKEYVNSDAVCQLLCHPIHLFHSKCLKEWVTQNYTCPYCRSIITTAN